MKGTVGEKGQVTIPKPLRESLGIVTGTVLEFEERDGVLLGRRAMEADPLSRLVGLLPRMDTDRYLEGARGPGWDAETDEKG